MGSSTSIFIKLEVEDVEELEEGPPRTSLLDLPNDSLLSILEQVYEERRESDINATQFRVAEILVNQRFYSLARFVWFRHLDISRNQRDIRLAGLIDDTDSSTKARRQYLRSLSVVLTNSFYHVLTSVVVCLPHLTTLSIEIEDDVRTSAITALADGISTLSGLKKLTLECQKRRPLLKFYERFTSKTPPNSIDIALWLQCSLLWACETRNGSLCETVHDLEKGPRNQFQFDWTKLQSLVLHVHNDCLLWAQSLLSALESAIANGPIPLRRLGLDFSSSFDYAETEFSILEWTGYLEPMKLLNEIKLEQLEISSFTGIPRSLPCTELRGLKILRLAGHCNLKNSQTFKSFYTLLSSFPDLTHLHLDRECFFNNAGADEMSKLDDMSLNFAYPELTALLVYLRQTDVILLTYGDAEYGREMRWTRMNKEEDFERDCWTL
ncbi:hypothetical protein JCM5353_007258 [Sporobolomyces roseus]